MARRRARLRAIGITESKIGGRMVRWYRGRQIDALDARAIEACERIEQRDSYLSCVMKRLQGRSTLAVEGVIAG